MDDAAKTKESWRAREELHRPETLYYYYTFGASAPLKELQGKFGFDPKAVVAIAKRLLGRVST